MGDRALRAAVGLLPRAPLIDLKILLSTHHRQDPNSGASGTAIALCRAFREEGHEADAISFDDMPAFPERIANLVYPPRLAVALAASRGRDYDVIDASTGDAWLWDLLGRPGSNGLLVTRSHGFEHLYYRHTLEFEHRHGRRTSLRHRLYWGGWRQWEVARSLRRADLVLSLNEEERDFAVAELGVDADRIEIVGNPIDDRILAAAAKANREPGARNVAYVGAYRPLKGVRYGSAALASVMEEADDVMASFIGTGVTRTEVLEGFPPELHDRVRTVERYKREELPQLLEGHGILLFPSLSEGFGKALIEGMACGLAPVAARSGGAQQILTDEVNGLLVARFDVEEMASRLLRLLSDPPLLRRLQTAARSAAQTYGLHAVAERTLELYGTAIECRAQLDGRGQPR